jgi:pyridinium-3,5-bisthiocarboxylic acid mononucleotide nickel chelatase
MIGYLDMPSGISGDMFLGCLVDAGWTTEALRETVQALGLPAGSWQIHEQEVMKGPLRATLVDVQAKTEEGHGRHLSTIRGIIEGATLPDAVKTAAIATFTLLAEAEASVHGASVESVHFHEVGAVDAIIDIVGAAAGLHALGIEQLHASALPLGPGWVDSMHGKLPLPAPATLAILASANAPTRPAPGPGELVTPTGAAIVAHHALFGQPVMSIDRIGIGAGQRDCEWPNVARLWLGRGEAGPVVRIETNIDDMNPQFYASVSERLFEHGALDVWLTPVQMKKGRPGVVLSVLAPKARESELCEVLLRETTTLGVRVQDVRRHEAARELRSVETPYGTVQMKVKRLGGQPVSASPEYEDCRRLADEHGVSVRAVHEAATAAMQPGSG